MGVYSVDGRRAREGHDEDKYSQRNEIRYNFIPSKNLFTLNQPDSEHKINADKEEGEGPGSFHFLSLSLSPHAHKHASISLMRKSENDLQTVLSLLAPCEL